MSWTDAEDALLDRLWTEGHSAAQIAARLPGKTRNAVISRASRRGHRRERPSGPVAIKTPRPPPRAREPKPAQPKPAPKVRPRIVPTEQLLPEAADLQPVGRVWPAPETAVDLMGLTTGCCRFPVGAATGADQLFCGRSAAEGESYCAGHKRVAGDKAKRDLVVFAEGRISRLRA